MPAVQQAVLTRPEQRPLVPGQHLARRAGMQHARRVPQLVERDAGQRRERMGARDDAVFRPGEQRLAGQLLRAGERLAREDGGVQLALEQVLAERAGGRQADVGARVGVFAVEGLHRLVKQVVPLGRIVADGQKVAVIAHQRAAFLHGGFDLAVDDLHGLIEVPARRREGDAAVAACEKRKAHLILQRDDLVGHRRLCQKEVLSGPGKAETFGHFEERCDLLVVHRDAHLPVNNRNYRKIHLNYTTELAALYSLFPKYWDRKSL